MVYFIIALFVLVAVFLVSFAWDADVLDGTLVFMTRCTAALAALIITGILIITPLAYGHAHATCARYGAGTQYQTKIVRYDYMSWACLVKTSNGKWTDSSVLPITPAAG